MLDKYPQIESFLQDLVKDLSSILGDNLLGVYLTGSLTNNAYIEGLSDIDVIVVVQSEIPESESQQLGEWGQKLSANEELAQYLDLAFVEKSSLLTTDGTYSKGGIEFYKGKIERSDNTIGDNLLVWDSILQTGQTLFGLSPREIMASVPHSYIQQTMKRELGQIVKMIDNHFEDDLKSRYYAITTLCRILYTLKLQSYCSKQDALGWYERELGGHSSLISAARLYMQGDKEDIEKINKDELREFTNKVDSEIV